MTNLIKRLFGREEQIKGAVPQSTAEQIATLPSVETLPDKLKANQDLIAFCTKYNIELSSGNNKGNSFETTTGEVTYTYSTGQQLREFTLRASRNGITFEENVEYRNGRDSGKISYDCRFDHRPQYGGDYSYLFRDGKYLGMRGQFGVCMGGSWFTLHGNDPLSTEVFEKAKPAIVALEALVGRTLIERPKPEGDAK